jgi:hypothetical protein
MRAGGELGGNGCGWPGAHDRPPQHAHLHRRCVHERVRSSRQLPRARRLRDRPGRISEPSAPPPAPPTNGSPTPMAPSTRWSSTARRCTRAADSRS